MLLKVLGTAATIVLALGQAAAGSASFVGIHEAKVPAKLQKD